MDATRYAWTIDPTDDSSHSRILRKVGSGKRVLELGPGPGHMTEHLTAGGNAVTCIEIDPKAAALAEAHAEKVIVADLDQDDLRDLVGDARFDVVIAADVLEHLRRPDVTLRHAAELLDDGGVVLSSIPNIAHVDVKLALLAGRWDYKQDGLLDLTHLRFFTRSSVVRLMIGVGLRVDHIETVRWPAFSTNLGANADTVPRDLLDRLLLDPDSETLQFVVQASVPPGGLPAADDEALLMATLCTPGVYGGTAAPEPGSPPATTSPSLRHRVRERLHRK
jgi:SAM-dependent methyltransferase